MPVPFLPCAPGSPTAPEILDALDALDRVMGDEVLYDRLLRRFQHEYATGATPLRRALALRDPALAQLWLHTLTGAAGMIGAHVVQALAAALEPTAPAPAEIRALERALLDVFKALGDKLPAQQEAPKETLLDPASGQALLARLAHLLWVGDGAAIDVLEHCASALAASLGAPLFQEVAAAAYEFDFDAAHAALTRQ